MRPFHFCPSCGTRLEPRAGDGAARCGSCGRSWYDPPAPTVGCVIVFGGRALVTLRAKEPHEGRYDVPGGFLEPGEHPLDGLRRELREELGVEIGVALEDCLAMAPHLYGDDGGHVLALGFKARLVSGEPRPADDVAGFRWVTAGEVDGLDFAWEHDRDLVRKALAHDSEEERRLGRPRRS